MRRYWKAWVGVLAIVALAAGAASYWVLGTPQYSLYQLKRACAERDYAKFQEFVDVERIATELGRAGIDAAIRESPTMSGLEQGMFTMMEPTLRERFKQEVSDGLRVGVESGVFLDSDFGRVTIRSMKVTGSLADITVTGHSSFFDKLAARRS